MTTTSLIWLLARILRTRSNKLSYHQKQSELRAGRQRYDFELNDWKEVLVDRRDCKTEMPKNKLAMTQWNEGSLGLLACTKSYSAFLFFQIRTHIGNLEWLVITGKHPWILVSTNTERTIIQEEEKITARLNLIRVYISWCYEQQLFAGTWEQSFLPWSYSH